MDWLKPEVVVAAVGVLLSTGISIWALVSAKRGSAASNAKAQKAIDAAEALAAEARRSADAAERAAAANERAVDLQEATIKRPMATWEVSHLSGHAYTLRNTGDAAAYKVELDVGDLSPVGEMEHHSIHPGSAVQFGASAGFTDVNRTLTVSWSPHSFSDKRYEWRHPLPL